MPYDQVFIRTGGNMAYEKNNFLTGKEARFEDSEIIVSKTDLTGKLTYGNDVFYRLAGLSEKECIGQQHNIIRHPQMPRTVFDLLWDTIKDQNEIFAYVNNRSKNGDNYWVFAHVTPSRDMNGAVTGYHSNRRTPNRQALDNTIIPLYSELFRIEQSAASPKQGIVAGREHINNLLKSSNAEFNQLMFSLGV